jgi:hypothetical protein
MEIIDYKGQSIPWLSDEEYAKAVSQLRLQIGGALRPLEAYGQAVYVTGAVNAIMKLAEDFGLRVRGIDQPISLEIVKQQVQFRE